MPNQYLKQENRKLNKNCFWAHWSIYSWTKSHTWCLWTHSRWNTSETSCHTYPLPPLPTTTPTCYNSYSLPVTTPTPTHYHPYPTLYLLQTPTPTAYPLPPTCYHPYCLPPAIPTHYHPYLLLPLPLASTPLPPPIPYHPQTRYHPLDPSPSPHLLTHCGNVQTEHWPLLCVYSANRLRTIGTIFLSLDQYIRLSVHYLHVSMTLDVCEKLGSHSHWRNTIVIANATSVFLWFLCPFNVDSVRKDIDTIFSNHTIAIVQYELTLKVHSHGALAVLLRWLITIHL